MLFDGREMLKVVYVLVGGWYLPLLLVFQLVPCSRSF